MTEQLALPKMPSREFARKTTEVEIVDDERQRALEGLPHYWKLGWGGDDMIILPCGHHTRVWIERLEDPKFKPRCPYAEFGACK